MFYHSYDLPAIKSKCSNEDWGPVILDAVEVGQQYGFHSKKTCDVKASSNKWGEREAAHR